VSKIAARNLGDNAELIEDLSTLLLESGERISGEVCIIIETISIKEKVVEYFSNWSETKSLTTAPFIQLIRNTRDVISELSLLPDRVFIPYLNELVGLVSDNRHRDKKEDNSVTNLARNEKTVRLEISKINNPLFELTTA